MHPSFDRSLISLRLALDVFLPLVFEQGAAVECFGLPLGAVFFVFATAGQDGGRENDDGDGGFHGGVECVSEISDGLVFPQSTRWIRRGLSHEGGKTNLIHLLIRRRAGNLPRYFEKSEKMVKGRISTSLSLVGVRYPGFAKFCEATHDGCCGRRAEFSAEVFVQEDLDGAIDRHF